MKIFAQAELAQFLADRIADLQSEVFREDKDRLLNAPEAEYVAYLVARYTIPPLEIGFEELSVSEHEQMISADRFPGEFNVYEGKSYPKQVITYHLPYQGNEPLLHYMPSTRVIWTTEVEVDRNDITFQLINWRDDPEALKREAESVIGNIRRQFDYLQKEVSGWNAGLPVAAQEAVTSRKRVLLAQLKLLSQLGVPVRQSSEVPSTFAVPIEAKKPIIRKPESSSAPFSPEPALDDSTYLAILRICNDMGREMERHPAVYSEKDEESLRDHFIMVLAPHFQSVTGETFNKTGKTDILIRHEGGNVFVAECKFWQGPAGLSLATDQLLSYLTWRDAKAALILFVRNKDLTSVLAQIEPTMAEHPCFVKAQQHQSETWFNLTFHLPVDSSRHLKLAVLCFHFPAQLT